MSKESEYFFYHDALTLFFTMQNFVEGLSNHTGYPISKLVGKKIWRVYDTLTCQVYLIFHCKRMDTHINTTILPVFCSLQMLQLLIQTPAAEQ